jgi:hypothetical protein
MARRPERVLRFAWDPGVGGAVEPPTAEAETGWTTGQRPPAMYLNALLNNQGSWSDFLRGPSLARWSRVALGSTFTGTAPVIAADTTTVEGATVVRRLVAAGTDGTSRCVYVSHRGDTWTRRANLPVGIAGTFSRIYHADGFWWLLMANSGDGYLLTTPSDLITGSALDGAPDWDLAASPGTGAGGFVAMAHRTLTGGYEQVLVTSTGHYNGGSASAGPSTFSLSVVGGTAPSGTYTDVVWDGTTFVAVTSSGYVVTGTGTTYTGQAARITVATGILWRLTVGADGEVIAWQGLSASEAVIYRSVDHGVTWSLLSVGTTGLQYLSGLVYADGGWVATSAQAPFLWSSNDLLVWTRGALPYDGTTGSIAYGAAHCEGAWAVLRADAVVMGGRAEDLAPGAWSADPTPTMLGNAGWLRGYRISATAPTSGQMLAWDGTAYTPTTPSGGSTYTVRTQTTTYTSRAGDVILADATGGAFTVTLPVATGVTVSITVKKIDASANAVTIDGNAAETIDGAATRLLSTQYEAVTLWSDGTNWWVF